MRRRLLLAFLLCGFAGTAWGQLTLTSLPNPSTYGQTVTFSVTGVASGTVATIYFRDLTLNTTIGSTTSNTYGGAAYSTSSLTLGAHRVQASYQLPSGELATTITSNIITQNVKTTPTISLSASPSPAGYCQAATFTATVSAPTSIPSAPIPTGTVQFIDNQTQTVLGTGTLTGGVASFSTSGLAVGTSVVIAAYLGDSAYVSGTSKALSLTVSQATTSTSLTSSLNPSTYGAAVTFTASVTGTSCGVTGSVTFMDSTTVLSTVQLSGNATATYTISSLTAGTHSITANYRGDNNNRVSTSNTVSQVVNTATTQTTTALTVAPNPATAGQAITMTATVSPSNATGTVTFRDGATTLGTVTVAGGTATYTASTGLTVGTHSITAIYNPSGAFTSSTSSTVTLTVTTKTSTTTTLSASATSVTTIQGVTLTAVVSPAAATGAVTFLDGGTIVGTAQLSGGTVSITLPTLSAGSHTFTASYAGDASYSSSTSGAVTVTAQGTSSITFAATPNPATYGTAVTLSAFVTPVSATGTVTFQDGSTVLTTMSLSNGMVVASIPNFSAGTHTLIAVYSGNSQYAPSTSAAVTLLVNQAATTTTLSVLPASAGQGQTVTLTATVSPGGATGTVTFLEGTASIGTASVSDGAASLQVTNFSSGTHTLTASYAGNANYAGSVSNPVTVTVGLPATNTQLTVSAATAVYGDGVTLTARVGPSGATGTVTFKDGATTVATASLSNGSASVTVSTLPVGTHSLTAVYGGDASYAGSTSSAVALTVTKADTKLTLSVSPNPATTGQAVALTAAVSPSGATGTVTFFDGRTNLGTATLSRGTATLTTTSLTTGSHSLTASYGGDTNFSASVSPEVSVQVSAGGGTLTVSAPASLPDATVGTAYSQRFSATGGTPPYKWTVSGGPGELTMSTDGILSGTPTKTGTYTLAVTVADSAVLTGTVTRSYSLKVGYPTVSALALSIDFPPTTYTDQPSPVLKMSTGYPVALSCTVSLSFLPNAANLPSGYTNKDVQYASGGTTATITIPANSTAAVSLPKVQLGSVAGDIVVTLTSMTDSAGQTVPVTGLVPVRITVPREAPVIVAGTVRITNIAASGFSVTLNASSTPRDLTGASFTFTAASGTQLTGTQSYTVQLGTLANTWFASTDGVNLGGSFSLTVPFTFSGDTSALSTVSATLTNSVGTSAAVSGSK